MSNQKLSEHFQLHELFKSNDAARLRIDNTTDNPVIIECLKQVAIHILEPVRVHFNTPFAPNSGYRCIQLNRAIKSADTSHHVKGQAVDFEVPGVGTYDLACWCRDNLPSFDQLILEYYEPGTTPDSGWVHCSYVNPELNRNECLTINRYGKKKGLIK